VVVFDLDVEGRVTGTGTWTEVISSTGAQTTDQGAFTGHFERNAAAGQVAVCPGGG